MKSNVRNNSEAKQIRILLMLAVMVLSVSCSRIGKEKAPMLSADTIDEVIAAMSLEEKAMLAVGTGMEIPEFLREASAEGENPFSSGTDSADPAYAAMVEKIRKFAPGAAGRTAEISRLGIPTMVVADGPAGLRIDSRRPDDSGSYFATAFPVATQLASS